MLLNPDTELLDDGLDRLAAEALRARRPGRPAGAEPRRLVQPSASGPEVGAWPWVRALVPAALQPARLRARTEPYRLERRLEVTWLTGACIAGPTEVLARLGPFDPALHMFGEDIDLGLRAAAAGIRSWFDPSACRIVHHGQGSSTLAYGSREGWRPTGTLNWRAALRRAYGPRREWLGVAGPAREPAPAAAGEDAARPRRRPRPRRGRGGALGPAGARAAAPLRAGVCGFGRYAPQTPTAIPFPPPAPRARCYTF